MANELLSICIPTRNRARYLKDLLGAFAGQVKHANLGSEVRFYISDNASEDETPEVMRQFRTEMPNTVCSRNQTNIGADRNFAQICAMAKGKYLWVIGDDELLCNNALTTVLELIDQHHPGLIIAFDTRYDSKITVPRVFPDYREFAKECVRVNTYALAEHTLISSNILRADCYDGEYAITNIATFYAHMFGMIRPLLKNKACVVVPATPIITVRDWRPGPVDGKLVDVSEAWRNYFTWLREELQLPELDPDLPSEHARKVMLNSMIKSPLRFFASNWRSLFDPKAYRLFFNRIFRRSP